MDAQEALTLLYYEDPHMSLGKVVKMVSNGDSGLYDLDDLSPNEAAELLDELAELESTYPAETEIGNICEQEGW